MSQRTATECCCVCDYLLGGDSCRLPRAESLSRPGVAAWNAYHADSRSRQLREYYRLANRKAMRRIPLALGCFLYTSERARSA